MRISSGACLAGILAFVMGLQAQQSPTAMFQSPPPPAPPGVTGACAPNRPIRISGAVMAGLLVSRVDPVYPPDTGAQGAVVLHAIIGADGFVTKLIALTGAPALRSAAIDAVRQWRYQPYLLNGQPVAVDTTVTVNFRR